MNQLEQLRDGLDQILADHPDSLLLGEDILDPYGGAFKVTKGLSTRHPDQVLQTPISEAGFFGVATGLAYLGFKPVVEVMFGDFLTLLADGVVNSASKLGWLARGRMGGDVLVRAPAGGRRGYGPIHSQSLEKLFFGWPDVEVFAPNLAVDAGALLVDVFRSGAKVKVFVENKSDYGAEPWTASELARRGFRLTVDAGPFPMAVLENTDPGRAPDAVVCCYGGMLRHAADAAFALLMEDEITTAICAPTRICPPPADRLSALIGRAGRLVCAEEGYARGGWGTYLLGELTRDGRCRLPLDAVRLVGPAETPIPAAVDREAEHLPSAADIVRAVREVV